MQTRQSNNGSLTLGIACSIYYLLHKLQREPSDRVLK